MRAVDGVSLTVLVENYVDMLLPDTDRVKRAGLCHHFDPKRGPVMAENGISLGNVIGHNESLTSPYHHEAYPSWRCQTHGDFPRAAMDDYRSRLRPVLARYRVAVGPPARRVRSSC